MHRLNRLTQSSALWGSRRWSGAVCLAAVVVLSVCGASIQGQEPPAPAPRPEAPASPEPKRELANPYDPTVPLGLGETLPRPLLELSFLELALWQWLGLALLLGVAFVVSLIATLIVWRISRIAAGRTETIVDDRLVDSLYAPFRFLLFVAFFGGGAYLLALSDPAYRFLSGLELALAIVAITWGLLRVVDVAGRSYVERLKEDERKGMVTIVPLAKRVLKFVISLIALIALLQNIGFNVSGLVAGLGVGGIAIALAAQKSIANLFGGFSLVADQPIRVGDFCRFGDGKVGTVEEIGIRSTRIRTLDRTLVTIPNSEFAEIQLENFAARDQMRVHAMIGLRYETTPDQLRHVLAELRRLLVAHPLVTETPRRVRLVGFGAHSLDLEVFAYVAVNDWNEFLKIREDIYLRMMDVIRESGTGFAFPSQTLYLGRDRGLNDERRQSAESQVQGWREVGELPFPDFREQTIAETHGTLDYPPRGSSARPASED
jgi:MscS family membrane protein